MGIISQVQILLNDNGVFWPFLQVLDAVNEAQLWAYAQTKWQRTPFSLSLVAGTDLFTLPTGVVIPGWIETAIPSTDGLTTSHTRGFPTTQRELEHFLRTWRGQQPDVPRYFVIWDAYTLRLFPRPDKAYNYTLWGVSYPTEITSDVTLGGPELYQLAVQNMAAALLFEATRPDLADVYMGMAEEQIVKVKVQLRNQQSHNIRRLRPGSVSISGGRLSTPNNAGRFDLQQGGSIAALPTYYPLET